MTELVGDSEVFALIASLKVTTPSGWRFQSCGEDSSVSIVASKFNPPAMSYCVAKCRSWAVNSTGKNEGVHVEQQNQLLDLLHLCLIVVIVPFFGLRFLILVRLDRSFVRVVEGP